MGEKIWQKYGPEITPKNYNNRKCKNVPNIMPLNGRCLCGIDADNDFRDGAGCFGNNDEVPPSEVSKSEFFTFIKINKHFPPSEVRKIEFFNFVKIISQTFFRT